MEKHKNEAMPIRVYKPTGMMQIGLAVIAIFVVAHFAIMMQVGSEDAWLTAIFIPFYGFMIWLVMISSSQQYLALYEDGIEYRMGSNRVFSRWEDLSHFEMRAAGKTRIAGIYTNHLIKRAEGSAVESFLLGGHKNFIPLSNVSVPTRWDGCWTGSVVDVEKLRYSDFGRELYHYAPHLFEGRKEKMKYG